LTIPGLVSGPAGVTITDAGAMTVVGNILSTAGPVAIADAGPLTISGSVTGQLGVTQIVSAGDMTLSGVITGVAGLVTIGDTGVLSVTGSGTIASATSITITDTNVFNFAGLLSAPHIVVDDGAGLTNISGGARIQTSGEPRPDGVLTMEQLPTAATSAGGFFLTTGLLVQSGTLLVSGDPNIVRIDASRGIVLAPPPGGIVGPDTWLILGLSSGAAATGGIEVFRLDTVFVGTAGGSTLSGSVGGLGGIAAAGAAHIAPGTNAGFRINGCPISSINCILITTQGIPTGSPLNNFVIGSIFDPTDEDDLLLPLVSDEVY
jgi:hypothetical protein